MNHVYLFPVKVKADIMDIMLYSGKWINSNKIDSSIITEIAVGPAVHFIYSITVLEKVVRGFDHHNFEKSLNNYIRFLIRQLSTEDQMT